MLKWLSCIWQLQYLSNNELISDALCPIFRTPVSSSNPRAPSGKKSFEILGVGKTWLILSGHHIRGRGYEGPYHFPTISQAAPTPLPPVSYGLTKLSGFRLKTLLHVLFIHVLTFNPPAYFPHWECLSNAARLADDEESGSSSDSSCIQWVTSGADHTDHSSPTHVKRCAHSWGAAVTCRCPLANLFRSVASSILFLFLLRSSYLTIIVPVFACVDFSLRLTSLVTPLKPSCLTPPPTPRSRQA